MFRLKYVYRIRVANTAINYRKYIVNLYLLIQLIFSHNNKYESFDSFFLIALFSCVCVCVIYLVVRTFVKTDENRFMTRVRAIQRDVTSE